MPRLVLLCASLCVMLLASGPVAHAQKGKPAKGVVQQVDTKVGTITLIVEDSLGAKKHRVKTFNLSKPDLPVLTAEGKSLKLTDLAEEQRIFFDLEGNDIVAIRLAPPTWFGTLTKVDTAQRTLALVSKFGTKTFEVPATAKIHALGSPVPFESLTSGQPALISLSEDHKTVIEVRVGKGAMPLARLVKGTGTLLDFDAKAGEAKVLVTSGGDVSLLREVTLSKDISFNLLYQSKPFRDLMREEVHRGVKVHFWTDFTTRKLVHVEVEMPILARRTVKSFDPESRQLVLEDADGDKMLTLTPQAKIHLIGKTGALADLKAGVSASCGLSPDRKHVEIVNVFIK